MTLAMSVGLLSLAAMACCVSREIIWMHTMIAEKEVEEKKKAS